MVSMKINCKQLAGVGHPHRLRKTVGGQVLRRLFIPRRFLPDDFVLIALGVLPDVEGLTTEA